MQQLLTIAASSERFTSTGNELSNELDKGSQAGEFARILMKGNGATEAPKGNPLDTAAVEFAKVRAAELQGQADKSKPSSGNNLQRFEFDDKNVGAPVEAPILELLEQMQAILPQTSEGNPEATESGAAKGAVDETAGLDMDLAEADISPELLDKLSAMLEQLGTERLSDEQRQQLADQFAKSLSKEQRQLFADIDDHQLGQLLAGMDTGLKVGAGATRTNADESLSGNQQKLTDLLERLQQFASLADKAAQQLEQLQAGKRSTTLAAEEQALMDTLAAKPSSNAGSDLEELKGWLKQQVANLSEQQNAQQTSAKALTVDAAIARLRQSVDAADDLSNEQKQQLQAMLDKLMTQSQAPSANSSPIARLQTAMNEVFKQMSGNEPSPANAPVKGDKAFAISATATPTETDNGKNKNADTSDVSKPLNPGTEKGSSLESMLSNKATTNVSERVSETTNAMAAERLTPTATQQQIDSPAQVISTQAGGLKASEVSSTLQSSMQAIQKPFDPQQTEASQKLQERIQIMLSKNVQRADIRLDPPELGQLHVRVNMNGEQASVQFQAQSTQAKDALEAAMPRLREMLEQQGVALADTEVAEQQQQTAGNGDGSGRQQNADGDTVTEHEIVLDNGKPVALGNVDFYV